MPDFTRTPRPIFALQIISENFEAIEKHFDCDICVYGQDKAVEYDGEIGGLDWRRFFSLTDWVIDDLNGSTPRIMDVQDFRDEYLPAEEMSKYAKV